MLSASCFDLEQSKILSYGNGLSNILASDDDNDIHPGSDKNFACKHRKKLHYWFNSIFLLFLQCLRSYFP